MKNSDFKFFYCDGQYFCAVKLPIGRKPICYMAMGNDNRPFEVIVADIKLAFDLLISNDNGDAYTKDLRIAQGLPSMLGYRRATRWLKAI